MDFSLEQANDVIGNSKNEHHGAFHSNTNPDVVAAVNRAFQVAYPGETTVGDPGDNGLPAHINEAMNAEVAKKIEGGDGLSLVDQQTVKIAEANAAEVRRELQGDWGREFETNMEQAGQVFRKLFPSDAAFEKIGLHLNPSLQAEAVRLLLKIAKSRK